MLEESYVKCLFFKPELATYLEPYKLHLLVL